MTEIQINNEQELRAVLTVVEKTMPDVSWPFVGDKPTDFIPLYKKLPIRLTINNGNYLTWGETYMDSCISSSTFISQQLPSWCVKNDGSCMFFKVIDYLERLDKAIYSKPRGLYLFYGVKHDKSTDISTTSFGNLLTISEFETIFGVQPKWEPKQGEFVRAKFADKPSRVKWIYVGRLTSDPRYNIIEACESDESSFVSRGCIRQCVEIEPWVDNITLTRGDQVLTPPFDEQTKQELKRLIG